MKMKISFWNKGKRYFIVIDMEKVRLDELLICLDKQYPKEKL